MNAREFFLYGHARSHSGKLVGVEGDFAFYEDRALHKLTEDQVCQRPQGLNSIAWLLWHIARTEDAAANIAISGRPQVLDSDNWTERMNSPRREIGGGMTPDEVADLTATVDVANVRAYRMAVGQRTRDIATAMSAEEWDAPIKRSRLEEGFSLGAFRPDAKWPFTFWGTRTAGELLTWPCLGHSLMHLGQAMWVRRLILEGVKT